MQIPTRFKESGMSRILKQTMIAVLVLVFVANGFAQTYRLGFFINAAGYIPDSKEIGKGFGTGIGAVLFAGQNIAVSFEWKYNRFNVDKKEGEFYQGNLYMTPLLASIRYRIQTGTAFTPYFFGGGGIFLGNYQLDKSQNLERINIRKQDINAGLGLYGGIGGLFKFNQKITAFIEGLYLWGMPEVKTSYIDNTPASTFKANLSSISLLIGLIYFY